MGNFYPERTFTQLSDTYTHEEIIGTLEQWYALEAREMELANQLPETSPLLFEYLEPIVPPQDMRRRVGSQEPYPVATWRKLIKRHEAWCKRAEKALS